MNNNRKLNHTTYDCKYHIVWIPKYRKKAIYGQLRKYLGEVFRDLALQRESEVLEGHLMGDHVHMLIAIPPKYSVAQVVGYIKLTFRSLKIGKKYLISLEGSGESL
jgi:putative transposase